MLTAIVTTAAMLGLADFGYDRVVHFRHDRWERTIERDANGLRKGYEDFTIGTGDTALLMIHGFGAGPLTWGRMAPALAERGFTCRALCLQGFGRPMEEYRAARSAQWRTQIRWEVDSLRQTHQHVWLVAHSMGGALALLEAMERPDAIDGIVLLAPLIEVSSRRSPLVNPQTWFKIVDRLSLFTDLTEMAFPVDVHDPAIQKNVVRDQFVPRTIYRELFALTDALKGRAEDLRVPTLLAYAPADKVTDAEAARRYVVKTSAPRKEFFRAERSGHVLTWDFEWENLVDCIEQFVRASD